MNKVILLLGAFMAFCATGVSQSAKQDVLLVGGKPIGDYLGVLEKTQKARIKVDPAKGYWVGEIAENFFLVTDGVWQSGFLTTGKGVIVFDAPSSYGAKLIPIIKSQTNQPVTHLVYSHAHKDHIAGAIHLSAIPNLKILGHKAVAEYLKEVNDPNRPIPTLTFERQYRLKLGSEEVLIEEVGPFHSSEADVFITFPRQKILFAIDTFTPGWVTFQGLDLTANVHNYLKVGQEVLSRDFQIFIGGHLTQTGTRAEVEEAVAYNEFLLETATRVFSETQMVQVMSEAAQRVGWDNPFLLFRYYQERMVSACAKIMIDQWGHRLSGVDVWAESHCDKVITYLRVD